VGELSERIAGSHFKDPKLGANASESIPITQRMKSCDDGNNQHQTSCALTGKGDARKAMAIGVVVAKYGLILTIKGIWSTSQKTDPITSS
jgi:hypothetical protein